MREGLCLSLVILRGKLRNLSTWAGGSHRAVADGLTIISELTNGRVRELVELGAGEWPHETEALRERWAKLHADWRKAEPPERMRQTDGLISLCDVWIAECDRTGRSGGRPPGPFDGGGALPPVSPSLRSLFLRGEHAQAYVPEADTRTSICGRRLADWCLESANGVRPDLRVAGVTYWVALADGKARAFSRHERVVRRDGVSRAVTCWRAIAAPNLRLLKMRLATKAGVSLADVQTYPTFEDEAQQ